MTQIFTETALPIHSFHANTLRLEWGAPAGGDSGPLTLNVPLGLGVGPDEVRFRRWLVRQGGAQSRAERGGGFVAVDFRKPYFHWRGKMPGLEPADITIIRQMDVSGWELWWPGLGVKGPAISLDETDRFHCVVGIDGLDGSAGYAEPRYWVLRRPGSPTGVLLACAGPGYVTGVELKVESGKLTFTFRHASLAPGDDNLPDFYMVPGISTPSQAEAMHARLVGKEGFVRGNERNRQWWRRPTLYVTNSILRGIKPGTPQAEALRQRIDRGLDALARRVPLAPGGNKRTGAIVALDTAWADAEGDWNPSCGLFADAAAWWEFRDSLHERGHSVLLTLAPFKVSAGSLLMQEQEWYILRGADGLPVADRDGDHLLDYTYIDTRAMMTGIVDFLLGRDEDSLGADGLVLAPGWGPPNAGSAWSDPTQGNGELLWLRSIAALAEAAREVLPEGLVEVEAAVAHAQRAGDRVTPLGLMGRRRPETVRELNHYGQPIPKMEGVRLARTPADWKAAARGDGYWGVVLADGDQANLLD